MKAEMISTDEFYVGNSEYAILVPIGCASGLIQDLIAIEAINDADFVQVMSDKAAFDLLANDAQSVGGIERELCQCSDLDVKCDACSRQGFDCKGGKE